MTRHLGTQAHPNERRRGSITVAAVLLVMVVFILSVGFLQLSSRTTASLGYSVDKKNAFYVAEAGLAEAYSGLAMGKTGNVGTPDRPATIGDGVFWVEATELADDAVQLESTALYGSGRVTLGLVAQRQQASVRDLGLYFSDNVSLNPDIQIDSYDSSAGTYADQLAAGLNLDKAILGSNGDVSLAKGNLVNGDIQHGAAGSASVPAGATVTGSISPRTSTPVLPPIEVPAIPLQPAVKVGDPTVPYVVPPGEHGFEGFTLEGKTRAVFTGPATLVFGDLRTMTDSAVTFDTRSGPIDVYVTGGVDLGTSSTAITTSGRPNDLTMQITAPNASLGAKSLFAGYIYAPATELKLTAQFEVFGGVVAQTLSLSAQGKLHMDLSNAITRPDVLPSMWSWRVVDIPDDIASNLWSATQALNQEDLPSPALAHEDQWLEIEYVDAAGVTRSYSGWESGFDWTNVSKVLSGSRDGDMFRAVPKPVKSTAPDPADPNNPADPGDPAGLPPLTPEDQAYIDTFSSFGSAAGLRRDLIANSPLSDGVLGYLIQTNPMVLSSPDLKQVLNRNDPLSNAVLMATIYEPDFQAGALKYVLLENSPLTTEQLEAAMVREPPLSAQDLNEVLAAQ